MSLKQYSKEQLQEMSLIEVAFEMLKERKQPFAFSELVDEMTALLNLTEDEVNTRIAQFYTDLNIDGRFLCLGDNRWGLRVWYPVDQLEEETVTQIKPKKKKAKKASEEDDVDIEDYDEIEEEEFDYEDIDESADDEEESDDLLDLDEADDDDDFEDDDEDLIDDEFELDEEEEEEDDDDLEEEDEEL
ncbi:DNA-directed RNA polymerase subunit delta [Cytobacillus spongiae]|uniref:DNA-directed RNA polymerase subunit delta n=1 Tax=Cytobacillus spongiae TaxID=2901381 RepID=UPI001F3FFEAD|nr:DNA-directed RNA polymerase subunit delta [Cytobacillus spongiae]UII55771.1 DNA-directed RNA polymerase subunit delta [Cytobacillus spongiae]